MALAHGISLGWFSPMLYLFFSNQNPFGAPLTISQASWAGSMVGLGAFLCNLILGWPLDYFGRKCSMYIIAIPNVINWILVYVGGHVACLYVARFLLGFSGGALLVVHPIFIAEISDDNVRGTLSTFLILNICVGLALGLIMGTYISYYVLPFIIGVIPVIYVFLIIPLPETPQFLLKTGRDEKAEKSFYFYKNLGGGKTSSDPAKEAEAKVEFNTFRELVLNGDVTRSATCRDFCSKATLKAIGLTVLVILCNTFSGGFAIVNYASNIFTALGSRMDPNTSANVAGVAQLLGTFCAVFVVDLMGRRWLLILSLVGTGLGELTVALLKSLASKDFLSENGWLGLTLICFVEFIVSLGLMPLTFVLIVELLPVKIRSVGASICVATFSVTIFLVLMVYPLLIFGYGLPAAMYMSASVCFFGAVILGIFMPETKGQQMG